MNAHQQLVELINRIATTAKEGTTLRGDALAFIRDHGDAILQLIHDTNELLQEPCSMTFGCVKASLRKLTQDE